MSSERAALLALLGAVQYADSAYPAGGFAHSFGLETAVAEGQISDAATLEQALRTLLERQLALTDAVAAAACARPDLARDAFTVIDRRLSATRAARESREASLRMGRRLLETAALAEADPVIIDLAGRVAGRETPGNFACVLGALCGRLGLAPAEAATLTLWVATNGLLAAAIRLLPLTHDHVQRTLVSLRPAIAALAETAAAGDGERLAGAAPQWEVWSMRHETANVRLFAS